MQMASSKVRWGVLTAILAAFAMAFALFAATPAQAADDLTAGSVELTAQSSPGDPDYIEVEGTTYAKATADTDVVLSVYKQKLGGDEKELVKQYTKAEIDALAISDDPIAVTYSQKNAWNVGVTTSYVKVDAILADAGIADLWVSGSYIDIDNAKFGTYAYDSFADAKFFPNTTASKTDTDGAVAVPMVLAIKEATGAIGEDQTANDMIAKLGAADKQTADAALRMYVGASQEDYIAGTNVAGNRLWSNVNTLTVQYYDATATRTMYRAYNPYSGEHLYTYNKAEVENLVKLGWKDEKEAWTAPMYSDTPVYRLYNPYSGDHHYTTGADERDNLVKLGWNDEGIGWYSADENGSPIYRLYNPYLTVGTHHYTMGKDEYDYLVSIGWSGEKIGFYGVNTAK